jgi:Cation efflux family
MSAEGSTRAIIAALAANLGIAVSKFIAFFITGSSSMLAEAVHSFADTSNEVLLLIGQRQAAKKPDALHQLGYGRSRFFYSFIVALVLFSMGSMFAIYEGYHKITHPHESLSSPMIAIVILAVAMVLEGYSLYVAVKESRPLKGKASWWQFIRKTRNPELPVVLLENSVDRSGVGVGRCGPDDAHRQHVLGRPRHHRHRSAAGGDRDHPGERDAQPADR